MANRLMGKLQTMQAAVRNLLDEPESGFSPEAPTRLLQRFAHFWIVAVRSFLRNRCAVRASALAYTTLLALIPLLAVAVGLSTFWLKKEGERPVQQFIDQLVANVAPQLDLVSKANGAAAGAQAASPDQMAGRREVVQRITEYINNVHSGTLGVTGAISLVLVAIMLLSTIETTFNDIWGVTRGRSWRARITNYWAAITLGPFVLIAVIGLTSGPHLATTRKLFAFMPMLGELLFAFLPFFLLIGAFTLFYWLMPHASVDWRAALVGGVVGGCLWQLNNIFNVIYISRVVTFSKIYGSLGMVPVFLVGMYFSWLILLFGAQVAYAFQNRRTYFLEKQAEGVNQRGREFVALRVMMCVGQHFQSGAPAESVADLSRRLGVPSRLVSQVLQTLAGAHLVCEVASGQPAYVPARPLGQITCQDILRAMRAGSGHEPATREEPARELAREEFARIQEAEKQAASATSLQALVQRLQNNP